MVMKKLGFTVALIIAIAFSAFATASTYSEGFNAPNTAEYLLVELGTGVAVNVEKSVFTVDYEAFIYSNDKERLIQTAVELTIADSEKEVNFREVGWRSLNKHNA